VGHGRLVGLSEFGISAGGINLGGVDLAVPQQFTQAGQGHAAFGQLTSEGVAELMWCDWQINRLPILLQQPLNAVRPQGMTPLIEKERFSFLVGPLPEPFLQDRIGISS
jgi:hypothetical protein